VIDYRISYDNAGSSYSILASGVAATQYTATGLTFGKIYSFKVEARNGFGYSLYSAPISILCAAAPQTPDTPTTSVVADNVVFDWTPPVDNGTPITGYDVYIRKSDLSYIIDASVCNGQNTIVTQFT
jgi:hypothetical protein